MMQSIQPQLHDLPEMNISKLAFLMSAHTYGCEPIISLNRHHYRHNEMQLVHQIFSYGVLIVTLTVTHSFNYQAAIYATYRGKSGIIMSVHLALLQ